MLRFLQIFQSLHLYLLFGVFSLSFLAAMPDVKAQKQQTKTWTNTPDWASASSYKNVTWTDVQGQIQLIKNPPKSQQTPFIYVPNTGTNNIAQLDTKTGKINWVFDLNKLHGNLLGPLAGAPSRTTVDANGNVWFGMRFQMRRGQPIGFAEGVVWLSMQGKVKKVIRLAKGPRAITVDLNGNVWVGYWQSNLVVKLDGKTGNVLKRIPNVACPYGAVADKNNNIWIVNNCKWNDSNTLTKISQQGVILGKFSAPGAYGIATDTQGQIWTSNWPGGCLHRFTNSGKNLGCIPLGANPRGVAVDGNGNVWVPCSHKGRQEIGLVVKVSPTGQVLGRFTSVGKHSIGIAVDADGYVWVVSYRESRAVKLRASDGKVMGRYYTGGSGPYTYSDMTGFAFQSMANPAQGYWRGITSSKCLSSWTKIMWNGSTPQGTSITVRARTAPTRAGLKNAKWSVPLTNGAKPKVPDNLWLEVEVAMRTFDAQITPNVTDITVISVPSGKEVCNGKDDNCNGIIDEGPDGKPLTKPCRTACGTGISPCVAGDWSLCSARYPTPEVCDGKDNDCDGKVDEQAPCESGSICQGGACAKECTTECPRGQICKSVNGHNICVGKKPCSDIKCPTGRVCRNGVCVDPCDGIVCPKDKPYTCVNGQCIQNDCYTKGCPAGQICRHGQCIKHPCDGVTCKNGEVCKNGNCVGSCAGKTCPYGSVCKEGQCQKDPCAGVKCAPGEVCNFGQCQQDPCKGAICRRGQICVRGQCIDNPCSGVRCPIGQVCRPPNGDCFGTDQNPKEETTILTPDGGSTIPTIVDGGSSGNSYDDDSSSSGAPKTRGSSCVCSSYNGVENIDFLALLALSLFFLIVSFRRRR